MLRSLIRRASGLLAGAALAFVLGAAPAQGASITYTDNNCASFSVTGSAPNFTLVCASLACSIASSAGLNINPITTPTVLTATCNPPATGWTWTASPGNSTNCPAITNSGASTQNVPAPAAAVSGCVYQLAAAAGAMGGNASVALAWSNVAPRPPSGCVLTATPSSAAAATSVTLAVTCSGGDAPTSYLWSGGSVSVSGPATQILTVSATTTFTVVPSNAGGNGNTASATVTIGAPPPPPTYTCSGFTKTVTLPLVWGAPNSGASKLSTYDFGHMGPNDAVVATFTTPAAAGNGDSSSIAIIADIGRTNRAIAYLSNTPCTFTNELALTPGKGGVTFSINYQLGGSLAPALQPNTQYFLNIKNYSACGATYCDLSVELYKPSGF